MNLHGVYADAQRSEFGDPGFSLPGALLSRGPMGGITWKLEEDAWTSVGACRPTGPIVGSMLPCDAVNDDVVVALVADRDTQPHTVIGDTDAGETDPRLTFSEPAFLITDGLDRHSRILEQVAA